MDKISILQSKTSGENKFQGIQTGWNVKIHQKIKEGDKTRVQAFEGTVISRKHGDSASGTVTIRKVSGGIGVEKTYPIFLPTINKVEVIRKTKVRRAKLYYLRDKSAKEIRKKIKASQKISSQEVATEKAE